MLVGCVCGFTAARALYSLYSTLETKEASGLRLGLVANEVRSPCDVLSLPGRSFCVDASETSHSIGYLRSCRWISEGLFASEAFA
jgi:hypothetical protein